MTDSTAKPELIRAHVFISGTVQGVGYRFSTVRKAQQLQVNGWVRNLSDGRVEAVFEGEKGAVESILAWCETGPTSAVVEDVAVENEEVEGIKRFETRY
ncbi:acylphosphatase [Oscillatoria salina]|uniref:acylphosphatase n=1 Tax=Oscillatoria salina TaxID=331517 RepID=UPI0013B62D7F|nr:acylphosphatase [Oscillatoria salina]MBZ8178936.1 acylphosphatase [Oscillatoria salina IIICB1]NET90972.1 acylphosphatase [Kamptonema sp. SIO1D9]